jgi:2,3-bisphosphoglycerate-independent phosphoglycerate mutase
MKTLFVLLDGAEDHPLPALGGKKPMDVAQMPYMEKMASHHYSTDGKTYTHRFLIELLTGGPPRTPRGALEALGLDMDLSPGRVAYRLSPALISNGSIEWAYCIDDRVSELMRIVQQNMNTINHLAPDINFFLKGRAVITLQSDEVLDFPSPPVPAPMAAVQGCLGELVRCVAEEMDGLTVMPWGGGRLEQEASVLTAVTPLTVVSNSPTALGISKALGQRSLRVEDLLERFPVAERELESSNVLLHVDETDEYSHQLRPDIKVQTLETTDRMLQEHFPDIERIVYLVDHGTSCITGEHLPVTVPVRSSFDLNREDKHIPLSQLLQLLMQQ